MRQATVLLLVVAVATLAAAGCAQPGLRPVPDQVQGRTATTLLLHLHHGDARPDAAALDAVRDALAPLPLAVAWRVDRVDVERRSWDTAALVELAEAGPATDADGRGVVHLHVLWVPGSFPDERGVPLAVFVRPDPVVAVFSDVVAQLPAHLAPVTDDAPSPASLQQTVLLHAVGHGLGLVDCGLPTQTPRGAHCHSDDPASVMHDGWGHLSGWLDLARAGHDLQPGLDADDRRDVCSAGVRCQAAEGRTDLPA